MQPTQVAGEAGIVDNVVPFAPTGKRRMVMVPEDEWREVLAAMREWKRVQAGCPVARRITQEG